MADIQELYDNLDASQMENDKDTTISVSNYLLNVFRSKEKSDLVMASYINLFSEETLNQPGTDIKKINNRKTLIISKILSNIKYGFSFENEELSRTFKTCVIADMSVHYLAQEFEKCQTPYEILQAIPIFIDPKTIDEKYSMLTLLILSSNPFSKENTNLLLQYFAILQKNIMKIEDVQLKKKDINRYFYNFSKILNFFKNFIKFANSIRHRNILSNIASPLIIRSLYFYNSKILTDFVFDQFIKSSKQFLSVEDLNNIPKDLTEISIFDYIKIFPAIISCLDLFKVRTLKESETQEFEPDIPELIDFLTILYMNCEFSQINSVVSNFKLVKYCSNSLEVSQILLTKITENFDLNENYNILRLLLLISYLYKIPGLSEFDVNSLVSDSLDFCLNIEDQFAWTTFFSSIDTMRSYTLAPIYDTILGFCLENPNLILYGMEFVFNAIYDYSGDDYENIIYRTFEIFEETGYSDLTSLQLLVGAIYGRYLSMEMKNKIIANLERFNLSEIFEESPTLDVLNFAFAIFYIYIVMLFFTQYNEEQTAEFENYLNELAYNKMIFILGHTIDDDDQLKYFVREFNSHCMMFFYYLILTRRNHLETEFYDIIVELLNRLLQKTTKTFNYDFIIYLFYFVEFLASLDQIDHPIYSVLGEFAKSCCIDSKQSLFFKKFYNDQEEIKQVRGIQYLIPFITTPEHVIEYLNSVDDSFTLFDVLTYAVTNNILPDSIDYSFIRKYINEATNNSFSLEIYIKIAEMLVACGMTDFNRFQNVLQMFMDHITNLIPEISYKKRLYDCIALLCSVVMYYNGPNDNTVKLLDKMKFLGIHKSTKNDCELLLAKYSQDMEQTKEILSNFDAKKSLLHRFISRICGELLNSVQFELIHEEVIIIMLSYVNEPPYDCQNGYGLYFSYSDLFEIIDTLHNYYLEHENAFNMSFKIKSESALLCNWYFRFYK